MKIQHKCDHTKRRAAEYPPVEEQLDMLWHAMNQGHMPKAEPYFSTLQQIKQQYPKARTQANYPMPAIVRASFAWRFTHAICRHQPEQ